MQYTGTTSGELLAVNAKGPSCVEHFVIAGAMARPGPSKSNRVTGSENVQRPSSLKPSANSSPKVPSRLTLAATSQLSRI
jgi:hypothetical protein